MGFFETLNNFYSGRGERCSRCNRLFQLIDSSTAQTYFLKGRRSEVSDALQCLQCGSLICGHCQSMIIPLCKCGRSQFQTVTVLKKTPNVIKLLIPIIAPIAAIIAYQSFGLNAMIWVAWIGLGLWWWMRNK